MERPAKRQRVDTGSAAPGPPPNDAADGGADADRGAQQAQGDGGGGGGGAAHDGDSDDDDGRGRCNICLDGSEEPPPIQRGCCCRGDGGLAHLACMVQLAAHNDEQEGCWGGWWECGTCKEDFTGAMQHGLALTWWARVEDRDEEDAARLAAAGNFADSHRAQGNLAEAAVLQVQVLSVQKRVRGEEHPATLAAAVNLALTYADQGRLAEAAELQEEVLAIEKRVLGEEHPDTLASTSNLALTYDPLFFTPADFL